VLAQALARRLPLLKGQIHYFFDGPGAPPRPYLNPGEVLTFSGETHRAFLARYAGYHQARWQSFEGEAVPTVAGLLEPDARALLSTGGQALGREELIDLLGLGPLLERQVHQLSHGESRKTLLARLLLRAPRLLILDDPFTGLDQATRARLRAAVERLLERPDLQILFIGARPDELPRGITHLLLARDLRVVAQGRREEVGLPAPGEETPAPGGSAAPQPKMDMEAFAERVAGYAGALAGAGAEPPELVRMTGVTVAYHGVTVLDGVDWTIRRGERWALLGPNGAGKTTLLSLVLADNPQAYRNEIRLFGRKRGSGESIWEIKQQTGWVSPELHAFYERTATALEVVLSGFFDSVGLHRSVSPQQRALAAGWLSALGLPGSLERPFAGLAAGQQRLVLLARALVKHPPLLVLDEPCQGLDVEQKGRFLGFVEELCARTSLALVYVTHDPDELPAAITHQMQLAHGKVVFWGKIVIPTRAPPG
jgi:molybdate transport system ATP-binding protein